MFHWRYKYVFTLNFGNLLEKTPYRVFVNSLNTLPVKFIKLNFSLYHFPASPSLPHRPCLFQFMSLWCEFEIQIDRHKYFTGNFNSVLPRLKRKLCYVAVDTYLNFLYVDPYMSDSFFERICYRAVMRTIYLT